MDLFLDKLGLLQKGLDVSWKRNEVIANNIANADTPGFIASKVEFENILKSELDGFGAGSMKATNQKHMSAGGGAPGEIEPQIVLQNGTSARIDGNNVNLENEMTELAKNNLLYQTLVQKTSKEIAMMKYAINEGKR